MSSSIVKSNWSRGIGTWDADLPAIILAPFVGGGGGPLPDACVCSGACGICPCPPPMRERGIPPDGGGAGGGCEKLCP